MKTVVSPFESMCPACGAVPGVPCLVKTGDSEFTLPSAFHGARRVFATPPQLIEAKVPGFDAGTVRPPTNNPEEGP